MSEPEDRVIRVTVEDLATGDVESVVLGQGQYVVTATAPMYVAGEQRYPGTGTVVLTLRREGAR